MAIQLPWLDASLSFPCPQQALQDPEGLLAAGGDLSPARLLNAYRQGIFPWFSEDDPILWWSPNPRCVIFPDEFQASRSLKKSLKKPGWHISVDQAFAAVISACAAPRAYADDTWISPEIIAGYCSLHQQGHAHSIEVWFQGELVGGLYGVEVGALFCGESMFSTKTDASKIAYWALTHLGMAAGWKMMDAQFENPHLISLGARLIARDDYLAHVYNAQQRPTFDWANASLILAKAAFPVSA